MVTPSFVTLAAFLQKFAFEKNEKYKVGNFVLEEIKLVKYHWDT